MAPFGMRASLEQPLLASRPGAFVAGLFDISDREPRIPALVAAPDWLRLGLSVDGEPVALEDGQTLAYWRALDLRRGVLLGEWRQRTRGGRIVRVRKLRLASLANRALAVQLARIEVEQPSTITISADIQAMPGLQLVTSTPGLLVWSTRSGSASLALATAVELQPDNSGPVATDVGCLHTRSWPAVPGEPRTFIRVTLARGDGGASNPTQRAQSALREARRKGLEGYRQPRGDVGEALGDQ